MGTIIDEKEIERLWSKAVSDIKPVSLPYQLCGQHAPFSIGAIDPDEKGGGTIYWCYSLPEALCALKWCIANGYKRCKLYSRDWDREEVLFIPEQ
jgi:hypothetical protein